MSEATRRELVAFAAARGDLKFEPQYEAACSEERVAETLAAHRVYSGVPDGVKVWKANESTVCKEDNFPT